MLISIMSCDDIFSCKMQWSCGEFVYDWIFFYYRAGMSSLCYELWEEHDFPLNHQTWEYTKNILFICLLMQLMMTILYIMLYGYQTNCAESFSVISVLVLLNICIVMISEFIYHLETCLNLVVPNDLTMMWKNCFWFIFLWVNILWVGSTLNAW